MVSSDTFLVLLLSISTAAAFLTPRPILRPSLSICHEKDTVTTATTTTSAFSSSTTALRSSSASTTTATSEIWSQEALDEFCGSEGIILSISTLGPGYRAVARAKHNTSQILGYCEGFLRPAGSILHLDKMEVFQKMVLRTKSENPSEFTGGGTVLGVGLLLGYICLLHGQSNGCSIAEFLAIDDADEQHRKLVQYYKRAGFQIVKYVGDDFRDIPDRMVWGGCGTLMREDLETLLRKWTGLLNKSRARKEAEKEKGE